MVEYAVTYHHASVNRACKLLRVSRSAYRYQPVGNNDAEIRKILNELAEQHCRYGFKKMLQKIRQRVFGCNHKPIYRVYCELQLNVRRKPKKRLPSRNKLGLVSPEEINKSWSIDFMSDALMSGKRFRTVNIIDDCNREVLGIKASVSLPAIRVTEFLDCIASWRGYPLQIRVDDGPENISK